MILKFCVYILLLSVQYVCPYKVLGVFPHPGRSHFEVFAPLMDKLAEKNHDVTVISHFPKQKPMKNYRDVSLKGTYDELKEFIDLNELRNHSREIKILGAVPLGHFAESTCETLGSKVIQDFLKENKKYDLIVIEMWTTDCYLGLVHKLKAPFIGLSSCVIMPWINDRLANIEHPGYIPVMFMDYSDDLNFLERVENTVMLVFNKVLNHFIFELPGREAARKYIDKRMPTLESIARNTSLLLVNSHFALNRPRPLVPAVIEVGGMHIQKQKPLPKTSAGLNILGIFPYPGRSHFICFEPLMKTLAKRGHKVTVISHFPQKENVTNYKDIYLDTPEDDHRDNIDVKDLPRSFLKYYSTMIHLREMLPKSCDNLQNPQVMNLANSTGEFDLVIFEMWIADCFFGVIYKLGVPYIGISSTVTLSWNSWRLANPLNPSYIPLPISPFSDSMSFFERLFNTLTLFYENYTYQKWIVDVAYIEAKKIFGEDLPDLDVIARNTSINLVNSHFTLQRPRPFVPNVIEVGGMFVQEKVKKLPQNIEKWINESTHGVIYFSMGSMIKGHSFPVDIRKAFLKAFSKLPQRILWKWENETLPGQPNNVMIQKWMPQFDILCHPNVKAYISHGGLLGTTEAVHCGVPMIVMPQYGDQFVNAAALQASGGGVILDFKEATEEKVLKALKTVLQPSFNKQAKKLSAAYKDRPMPPLDTAVYWVEYVARHGGAHHMKTKAVGMPWYQYLLLDVVAFLIFVLITTLAVIFYVLRAIFRLICTRKTEKVKTN